MHIKATDAQVTDAQVVDAQVTDVILHAFDWPYSSVEERAEQISQLGYRAVLVSPPMKSATSPQGTPWWQRYQPQDYRVIDNQLGDTLDFQRMLTALQAHGVWTYIDVVFNHMANESRQRLDLQYPSQAILAQYQQNSVHYQERCLFGDLNQPLFQEDDFVEAFGIQDWKDQWQVQNGRITGGPHDQGLPTLVVNAHVVEQQKQYIQTMKSMGVKGFRIDAAKHMSIDHLKRVWTHELTHDVHIFGEIITDGGATQEEYQLFLQPYLQETSLGAYDFPLFQTVFDALSPEGSLKSLVNPYCFGQALSDSRAITFAVTHDIPNNDVFQPLIMDVWAEALAYTYILGRDGGVPLIYTDLNTSGFVDESGAPRWQDAWLDRTMKARIKFHNQVHGLPMILQFSDRDCLVFSRGSVGLVVLNKSRHPKICTIDWPHTMQDLFSGQIFLCQKNQLHLTIPGRSSAMLLPAK